MQTVAIVLLPPRAPVAQVETQLAPGRAALAARVARAAPVQKVGQLYLAPRLALIWTTAPAAFLPMVVHRLRQAWAVLAETMWAVPGPAALVVQLELELPGATLGQLALKQRPHLE
jgi:hypothetical protein